MSVLACNRAGCENIMCRQMVLGLYLCDDCLEELLEYKRSWPTTMTAAEIVHCIDGFLESELGEFRVLRGEEIDKEFNRLIGGNR